MKGVKWKNLNVHHQNTLSSYIQGPQQVLEIKDFGLLKRPGFGISTGAPIDNFLLIRYKGLSIIFPKFRCKLSGITKEKFFLIALSITFLNPKILGNISVKRTKFKKKKIQCQLSLLATNYGWIAEELERWDRTSACKGRHSFSHFSRCFDHTSSTQTDKDTSQIDHDFGAYVPYSVSNRDVTGSFTSPFNWSTRMTNDATIWTERGVSQLRWLAHQFS